jgi:magnesium chelatase subunit D
MKLALVLNAINPAIGGVLIRGEKGTAKSTAARALANLLPKLQVAEGCAFGCDPADRKGMCQSCRQRYPDLVPRTNPMRVVELPISATEDKVVGTLDIGHALKTGEKKFEPGILAEANRNILYVDEVNLLNDHIVDVLLDVAAMGINVVEREGVSYTHPSSFILIGTMNPEEGELRPQLLDRFGLCVDIEGIRDPALRLDVIRRRISFEEDPETFRSHWESEERILRNRILAAQEILPSVFTPQEILELIVRICIDMEVDGHRADITMIKTAATIAACNGRREVSEDDVKEAADLVLSHRMRKRPFSDRKLDTQKLDESIRQQKETKKTDNTPKTQQHTDTGPQGNAPDGSGSTVFAPEDTFPLDTTQLRFGGRPDRKRREGRGRRIITESGDGRYVRSRIPREPTADIAFDATLRAAAPHQNGRTTKDMTVVVEPGDLREKVRERRLGTTILFVVDASGSMGVQKRMGEVKAAILSLLLDAYQKRDRVGLVAFRGTGAEVLLPPTTSVELAKKHLSLLPTGGKTPLASGLDMGLELIEKERRINRSVLARLVVISDGKANSGSGNGRPFDEALAAAGRIRDAGIPSLVIDPEQGLIRLGLAETLSEEMGAGYFRISDLRADTITGAIRGIGM